MNSEEKKLYDLAVEHLDTAYAPYSKFHVSAALLTESGKITTGVNIENAAYGSTICAERVAIFNYVNQGLTNDPIKCLLITGNTSRPISPCGSCRQVMAEFMQADTKIVLTNAKGDYKEATLADILPYHFTDGDLVDGRNK